MENLIEKGTYIAQHLDSGAYIAIDEYIITKVSSGYFVQSSNMVFGPNGFQQKAEMYTDFQWNMQRLHVTVNDMDTELWATLTDSCIKVQQRCADNTTERIISLQNNRYFFLFNGALVIPLLWLRGFEFDQYEKIPCQILPLGYAEVTQIQRTTFDSNTRNFSLMMQLNEYTDFVLIQTDNSGKIINYKSEIGHLTIKQQE